MARSRKPVNPGAENALDRMKLEVANELGISERVSSQGWSTMTSADCGRVGGHMVRRMIQQYESAMGGQTATATTTNTATTGMTGATGTMTSQFDINSSN
ncbi:alpha/beta-type small acid-soluble spore protein [Sporomusa sp.]|uniref:alpha/beta-type small acid-soluble spore protein n=1 Tax=Sporomusa sp. TaxID=2078658 RepID=UPI002B5D1151|nr:alpha/beta-type small acid-soluble spore protein [Sporomusa sp.]HWR42750.1 alpha/beta-type small acid-soluble spore protein [Sporomusa sp.]